MGDRAEEEHENACLDLFKEKTSPYELWILDWETKNTQIVRGNQSMRTENLEEEHGFQGDPGMFAELLSHHTTNSRDGTGGGVKTETAPPPKKRETHRSGKLANSLTVHGQLATSWEGGDLDTTTLHPMAC